MLQVSKYSKPLISVVLSTFNRVDLLKRAVDSVLRQTFREWELIVVDDGSTDATYNLVNEYLTSLENLRYLKHSNRKLPLSRNAGIQAAVGEYVTFLDSDDEYLMDHLELRLKYMRKNTDVDLIHGGTVIIGNQFVKDKNDPSKLIHLDECTIGGTFFGKRFIFQSLGGFRNVEYSEDSEFRERAEKIFNVRKVDFPTYIYHRESYESICNSISPEIGMKNLQDDKSRLQV